MDFYKILTGIQNDETRNPYAGKNENGEWLEGQISVSFLQDNFGKYLSAQECIDGTGSEGLKLYFAWLRDEGLIN